jgi:hypothetical protein
MGVPGGVRVGVRGGGRWGRRGPVGVQLDAQRGPRVGPSRQAGSGGGPRPQGQLRRAPWLGGRPHVAGTLYITRPTRRPHPRVAAPHEDLHDESGLGDHGIGAGLQLRGGWGGMGKGRRRGVAGCAGSGGRAPRGACARAAPRRMRGRRCQAQAASAVHARAPRPAPHARPALLDEPRRWRGWWR